MVRPNAREHLLDPHYTPVELAAQLVESSGCRKPTRVLDLAAGNGSLLIAARSRWPASEVYGVDIEPKTVQRLRRAVGHGRVTRCDVLDPSQQRRNRLLRNLALSVDLLVLNPPFSARGATRFRVSIDAIAVECSRAMAFVLEGLKYLCNGAFISAVLPASCFHSSKDNAAVRMLTSAFREIRVEAATSAGFKGCSVNVNLVHFNFFTREGLHIGAVEALPKLSCSTAGTLEILRGATAFSKSHAMREGLFDRPFIHSTNLHDHSVLHVNRWARGRAITSSVILLPRVGSRSRHKVSFFEAREECVISDCVIALRAESTKATWEAYELIVQNWAQIQKFYGGTCAQYITIEKLIQALGSIGFASTVSGSFGDDECGFRQTGAPKEGAKLESLCRLFEKRPEGKAVTPGHTLR